MTERRYVKPLKRVGAGLGLAAGVYIGASVVTHHADDLEKRLAHPPEYVQPSDLLADVFDVTQLATQYIAIGALGAQGVRQIRLAVNKKERALSELGSEVVGKNRRRKVMAVGGLAVGAAVMSGAYFDMAADVNGAQPKVVNSVMDEFTGTDSGEQYVLSNSETPELLSAAQIPVDKQEDILEAAAQEGVMIAPMRYEWRTAVGPQTDRRTQVLATSLPHEITGLPLANEDCEDVTVVAAKELGAKEGQDINMEGLEVKVGRVLENGAGFNLAPIIFNNEDFARCYKSNPDQPFSILLAEGEKNEIIKVLEDAGVDNAHDIANRVYVVPRGDFITNTEETVKNNVNGLMLEAMILGLGFAAGALSGRSKTELANNRRVNNLLLANGFDKRMLAKMYRERAGIEATASSLVAAPLIILVDNASNMFLPGASMGPNATTFLSVIGATYIANRIGTEMAIRRETKRPDLGKGHSI